MFDQEVKEIEEQIRVLQEMASPSRFEQFNHVARLVELWARFAAAHAAVCSLRIVLNLRFFFFFLRSFLQKVDNVAAQDVEKFLSTKGS
jgi:hypothetical protein